MRKWWNKLETGNQIAIIGLIVAILGLVPGYLVFFPTDTQAPITPPSTIVTTLETTTSGFSTETTSTSDMTQSPTSTEGRRGVAPAVRRDDPPLTLSRGYDADLDTLNRDWDVDYPGTSFRYDLGFTLGGAGQLSANGKSDFAVVSGPVRYETCLDATGYTSTLASDEVRPDVALCVRTSEDRFAFVRILEVIEPNHKAVKLAVTVWENA